MRHFIATALFCIFCVSLGQAQMTREQVEKMGQNGARYHAALDYDSCPANVFGSQPKYQNEEQFSGFGLTTAGQLGIKVACVETPRGPVKVNLNPNEPVRYLGTFYWLDNCKVKGRPYKNMAKDMTPQPAAPVAIVTEQPKLLPVCRITGDYRSAFEGHAENGSGQFFFNEELVPDATTFLSFNQLELGTHKVTYRVTGDDEQTVDCEQQFDVFREQNVELISIVGRIPRVRFCETVPGWKQFGKGLIYPFVCTPGQLVAEVGVAVAIGHFIPVHHPKPQPLYKNPVTLLCRNASGTPIPCPKP